MLSKTQFNGVSVIDLSKVPRANFLEGDFGKEALKEFKERVVLDYYGNISLDKLYFENGVVEGSNPFAVVLINQILPEGMRVATQADLETILKTSALDLSGTYEDSALVLRNTKGFDEYLAIDLDEQIKQRFPKRKIKYPVMVPLASLELVNDSNAFFKLAFKLKEDAKVIYAPQLTNENNGDSFSKTNKNGLPIFNYDGKRTSRIIVCNLSRLNLDKNLNLSSGWVNLADSDCFGRVVVLSY